MKCTQKAEKKLFLEGDLFMDGGKRASVRNIVILVLLGGFNLYRGLRGKAFQMDISSMFSGHKDGSPSACPHCGAQLQPGQFSCKICGRRIS